MARPVRLSLAGRPGNGIDGAWWPHTASVATELPQLIEKLQHLIGEIVEIEINWSVTEGPRDFETLVRPTPATADKVARPPRVMLIAGRTACVRLLVVPHMTSPPLGLLVLRRAAEKPVSVVPADTKLLEIANHVLEHARIEGAKYSWSPPAQSADIVVPQGNQTP